MLFTHKSEMLYLEHARVYLENDRILYAQDQEVNPQRFNFPHCNAQILALGTGTSLTNKAARKLAEEGVVLMFTGDQGMPYIMTGTLGYHPNEYAQGFIHRWQDPAERLEMAKALLLRRFAFTRSRLKSQSPLYGEDLEKFENKVRQAQHIDTLLGIEGDEVRNLIYRRYAERFIPGQTFRRDRGRSGNESAHALVNKMLNHGNNLAYALAAGALWHLGIPAQFPLIHGQTRNSGLILDVADLVKDAVVAPWAFELRDKPLPEAMAELRYRFKKSNADLYMMDTLKMLAEARP